MIKTILFDLDGTIINTPKLIMESFKYAINTHTNYKLKDDEITNVLGQTLDMAFEPFAKDLNHLNKMIQSFRKYSYENENLMSLYDDVHLVLETLKEKGYKLGIVTSKSEKIALKNLKDFKLKKYFSCIVTYNDTVLHKPNKEPLIHALKLLNSNELEAIYIGDHENDIKAGINANMKTGLMKYSHRLNEALKYKPDYVFENFKNVLEIINERG